MSRRDPEASDPREDPTGKSDGTGEVWDLQGGEEELELLYRIAPLGLCVVDADLRFVRVNRMMAAFNGRSVEEHLGRGMEEVVPEAARPQALALARRVLETGEPLVGVEVHTVSRRDPSREHWWLASCHPLRSEGRVSGLVAVLENVTQQKHAELEALARLAEVEALSQDAPVGLALLDADLRFVRVNERMAAWTGRSVEEHVGLPAEEVIPEMARAGRPFAERVLETGRPARGIVLRGEAADRPGVTRTMHVNMDPVRAADGRVTGLVTVVHDVTRLVQAEEAAQDAQRQAEERLAELEAVYRHAPVGIALLDADLRYRRVNDAMARIVNRTPQDLLGVRAPDAIPVPEIREQVMVALRRVLESGEAVVDFEVSGRPSWDPEVEHTWLSSRYPLKAADGRVTGVVQVVHDVTAVKQAEQEAQRRLEEIESVYRSTPVALCYVDRELRYRRVNDALARINGKTVEEHLGRRPDEVNPRMSRQAVEALEDAVAHGRSVQNLEVRDKPPCDPEVEHVYLVSYDPVRASDGSVAGLVAVVNDVTAMRQVEADALARLEEIEIIYRDAPVGLCLLDADLRFVRVNDRLAAMNGRPVDEHIGASALDVLPSVADPAEPFARQVLATGKPARRIELRGEAADRPGVLRTLLVDIDPVHASDGRVSGLIAVIRDVTELKRAEREACEARERAEQQLEELEAIYRSAPVGITLVDPDLRVVRVNEQISRIQGLSPEELKGRSVLDFMPRGRIRDRIAESFRRVLETGASVVDFELRGRPSADPEVEHTWLSSRHPLTAPDGSLRGIVSVVHDVTELKRAEKEACEAADRIRAQFEELEALYDATPVGLCLLDRELRYRRVNETLARMNGRPVAEHLGRSIQEILGDVAGRVEPFYQRVFEQGVPIVNAQVEAELSEDPGQPHTFLVSYYPVRNHRGEITGALGAVQDITLLKRQQDELDAVRSRLAEAQRVAGVGSWEWDIVDDKVWWSDTLYDLFGKDPRDYEPSFDSFFELVHPHDRSQVRRQIEATLELDEPYWVQFRVVRDDLSVRVLRASAVLERTSGGQAARLVGTLQDVTGFEGRD